MGFRYQLGISYVSGSKAAGNLVVVCIQVHSDWSASSAAFRHWLSDGTYRLLAGWLSLCAAAVCKFPLHLARLLTREVGDSRKRSTLGNVPHFLNAMSYI